MTAVRQTRSYLMRLFAKHGFHPRHDLGQNFLIDLNIIEFVVANAQLTRDDVVLEVGAGTGGMSTFMATQAGEVVSVELDPNMVLLARETTAPFGNITLLHQDALRNKNNIADNILQTLREKLDAVPGRRLKLVANLPYNVATPIVSNLIATDLGVSRMVITIQLELGLKMQAKPGDGTYGALSVWLQSQANVEVLKKIPPSVFWPQPKVNSAIVLIEPDEAKRGTIDDLPFFNDFVRRLFHQRRKFMRSVLVGMYRKELTKSQIDGVLEESGIAQDRRAESMEPVQLVKLANKIGRLLKEWPSEATHEDLETLSCTDDDVGLIPTSGDVLLPIEETVELAEEPGLNVEESAHPPTLNDGGNER